MTDRSLRKTTLILNAIVVVFFVGFLSYTFFARAHLESLAREFVTEKTIDYARPIVDLAETTLEVPLVQKLLKDDQIATIRQEIASYRKNPIAYVSDLTQQRMRQGRMKVPPPLLRKVAQIKSSIRNYYDETLTALIVDLRIFAVSNLLAGAIAFCLAYRSISQNTKPVLVFSLILFCSVFYCSHLYIDDLTFFRILYRLHPGLWYPVVLGITTISFYLDYCRRAKITEKKNPTPTTPSIEETDPDE